MVDVERAWSWIVRAAWVVLPFSTGRLIGDALAGHSHPVQVVGTGLAWALWALGLVATAVPLPAGLVVVRVLAPLTTIAGTVGAARTGGNNLGRVLGLVAAILACVVAFHPETGSLFVNGPAYPNERRFLLRPPAVLLLGPIPLAGALVGAGAVTGPLLLASKEWLAGVVVSIVGAAAVVLLGRSLHAMVKRFVVLVPAGLVVHDALVLRDPVLFAKRQLELLRAAPADTDSLDLTRGAAGLAVEVLLREKAPVILTGPRPLGRVEDTEGATARFLVTPTRPGLLLATALARRLPVD